ncbi:MAG: hypothetical protein SPL12_10655 [Bacteroidales bacterium]|jgi:hypothetical protein|nr:hypothetical protein [Bacteroidales bacterium]
MTLCIGWVRKLHQTQEICLIADSCFSGGQRFYSAPKIFPMMRGDCAIACAGATVYSFPIVEHIVRALEINGPIRDRAKDFLEIVGLVEDVVNVCLSQEKEKQFESPGFSMIIAGYSWRQKDSRIFQIEYSKKAHKMVANRARTMLGSRIAFIGDEDIVKKSKSELIRLLQEEKKEGGNNTIDMQPLDVLMDKIESKEISTIGGYPQMVKIYPYMRVLPIGFKSKTDNTIYYYGRPLMKYETFPFPIYDFEKKGFVYMKETTETFKREHDEPKELMNFQ